MEKLAILGGTPIREEKLFYGKQCIEEDDIQAVISTLKSDFLTCGPKIKEFEQALCGYTKATYGVAVSNGTAALHLACMVAGIGEGDEVITTPLTFAASANSVLYCGGTPVFADICEHTYNIDPKSIREKITKKTKAIIAVDFTGQVVQADEIRVICDEYGLIFIEDAAHSLGSKFQDKRVGSIADMTTMSFHPVKTITGGEGGAILTNQSSYYEKLMLYRTHGITSDITKMEDTPHEGPWCYEQVELGYNYRITDFQAALLISQLNKLDRFMVRRKEIVGRYNEAFSSIKEIILQEEIQEADTCHHLYIIRLDLTKLSCTRSEFFTAMSAENVQPQVHYMPVYWFPYYRKLGYQKGLCKMAELVYSSIMSIPLFPAMEDKDVEDVIKAVEKVVNYYRK